MNILKLTAVAALLTPLTASYAVNLMPDFADAPTGWTTDRADPESFGNVGTYNGRDNVLGIGIDSTDGNNQTPFYATKGKKHAISGGIGDLLGADLFVESIWEDSGSGHVRTGMWGVMSDGLSVTDYPILGFTNYGGVARFRVWDDVDWVDLAVDVLFGDWNSLQLEYTGSSYNYYVNGTLAYTDNTVGVNTTGFQDVIMQAYDFGDVDDAVKTEYVAHWANSEAASVPDAGGTLALLGLGLVGLMGIRKRLA